MRFGHDRNALRQVFFRAWQKHNTTESLDDTEQRVVAVAQLHPEYHDLLAHPEASAARDWLPESGESNPFLHMSLHIAIEEQLVQGSPFGIRELYARLCQRAGGEHAAQHWMMECLGAELWRAGRDSAAPDMQAYLACLARCGNSSI